MGLTSNDKVSDLSEPEVIALLEVLRGLIGTKQIEAHIEILSTAPPVVGMVEDGVEPIEAVRRAVVDAIAQVHEPYRGVLGVMTGLLRDDDGTDWSNPRKKRGDRQLRIGQLLERRDGTGEGGLSTRQVSTIEKSVLARLVAYEMGFGVSLPSLPLAVKNDPDLMSLAISSINTKEVLLPPVLQAGLIEARVTRFHPERRYYQLFREGKGSIADYVSAAQQVVEMVSINLATGHDMEMLIDTFEELIARKHPVTIRISLLDPELEYLSMAIAPVINSTAETLRSRVRDTAAAMEAFHRTRLSPSRRKYLEVWFHNCLPNGSAIIIDGDSHRGLFQLETKAYRTGMHKSFGFEVAAGSDFFVTLRDSYRRLIQDGRRFI